jgi:hypothetical protein
MTRRCYDLLREKGTITADEVTAHAMLERGLIPGPIANSKPTSPGAFSCRCTIYAEPARSRKSAPGAA